MSPEKITPIGQGEVMRGEKQLETIRQNNEKLTALFQQAGQLLEAREVALNKELSKSSEQRDSDSIARLQSEVIELEGVQNDIIDRAAEAVKIEQELRERILAIEARISEKGY
jgi:TRAP-type mannitol/chloroaromatic compound transport system substrate-binding protein